MVIALKSSRRLRELPVNYSAMLNTLWDGGEEHVYVLQKFYYPVKIVTAFDSGLNAISM